MHVCCRFHTGKALAATMVSSCTTDEPSVVGPVPLPFNNAGGDGDDAVQDPRVEEYEREASGLPSHPRLWLRCYQGTWVLPPWVPGILAIQRGFAPRAGDVVLASPPKCGTTWLKALAFAAMARGAHPPAAAHAAHPLRRLNPHDCVPFMEKLFAAGWGARLDALPSPRLMATHMHRSLLPPSVLAAAKVVYVCRDPKDMVVSMWHFGRRMSPGLALADVFEAACDGTGLSGPIWDHVRGYWEASRAAPEAVLFLRYEDMLRDPAGSTRRLARFVGMPFSEAEEAAGVVDGIVSLCSFDQMKSLEVNRPPGGSSSPAPAPRIKGTFANDSYFRRGQAGDWANHMTPEMAARLDAVVEDKLRGSGFSFLS